jgi:hypothetical protein
MSYIISYVNNIKYRCFSAADSGLVGSFNQGREIPCRCLGLCVVVKCYCLIKLDDFIVFFIFMFQVLSYISLNGEDNIPWALIQTALASVAQTAIIPMQDVLGLGSSARMNIPATQVKVHA